MRPVSWLHRLGPVLNQADINGCSGWAAANWLNSAVAVGNRRRYNVPVGHRASAYLHNSDGEAIYSLATRNDSFDWTYPPADQGSSGLGVGKALKALGVIDSYLWTFSFGQLLAHGARQPLLLGLVWTEAMSDPVEGLIRIGSEAGLRSAVDSGMGHEVVLRGVNWPRKLATIRNQWTDDWGVRGEAKIALDELQRLIIDYRGDVLVPTIAPALSGALTSA